MEKIEYGDKKDKNKSFIGYYPSGNKNGNFHAFIKITNAFIFFPRTKLDEENTYQICTIAVSKDFIDNASEVLNNIYNEINAKGTKRNEVLGDSKPLFNKNVTKLMSNYIFIHDVRGYPSLPNINNNNTVFDLSHGKLVDVTIRYKGKLKLDGNYGDFFDVLKWKTNNMSGLEIKGNDRYSVIDDEGYNFKKETEITQEQEDFFKKVNKLCD